jgi:predicted nucleic acid-binding protein
VGPFVADASVVCSWILPDESHPVAETAFARLQTHDALAPQLLWYEVRSVLITAHRRKRISLDLVGEGLSKLRKLNIATTAMEDDAVILHLASLYQLSAYDAAYLALALDRNLQLATLDKQLIAAAPRAGCVLMTASP